MPRNDFFFLLAMKYLKCNQRAKEGSPGSPALPGAFPELPVRPTQPSQCPENQLEPSPHVCFVTLKWQITLFVPPSESWGQILRLWAFISSKFHLLCSIPPPWALGFPFQSQEKQTGCKELPAPLVGYHGEPCSCLLPPHSEMPFWDQPAAAPLSCFPSAPGLLIPCFPSSLTRGDVSVSLCPLKSPPPDQHPPFFHAPLLSRCKCKFKCELMPLNRAFHTWEIPPLEKPSSSREEGKNENNGSAPCEPALTRIWDPSAPPWREKLMGWCENSWWESNLHIYSIIWAIYRTSKDLHRLELHVTLKVKFWGLQVYNWLTSLQKKLKLESKIKFQCLQIAFSRWAGNILPREIDILKQECCRNRTKYQIFF